MRVWIHRCCAIVGEGAGRTNVLNAILEYSVLLRAVPIFEKIKGFIDYAPAEEVARGILTEIIPMDSSCHNQIHARRVTFIHHTNERKIRPSELGKHLEKQEGYLFEEMPLKDWIERAEVLGISRLVTLMLKILQRRSGDIYFAPLLKNGEEPYLFFS